MVINQELKINILERRVTAAYQRELRPNLIIHGILEGKEESQTELLNLIKSFLKDKMALETEIELNNWYRMGQGQTRPIMIKLKYVNEKSLILSHALKLQGKTNETKKLFFIHEDLTEEQSEVKQQYKDLLKENKDKEGSEKLQVKLRQGQLVVNNETVKKKVQVPSKADILHLDDDELEQIRAVKLTSCPQHQEKGSEYYSYGIKIRKESDVQKAYQKLKVKHADAMHISCVYQLENAIGPYRQEAIDDNDFGIGRTMLKVMKSKEIYEMAIFVVQYYGDVHLRCRHFEIAEFLTEKTIQSVFSKLTCRKRRTQRQNSEASIMSVASVAESQDEGSDDQQEWESAVSQPEK